MPMNNESRVTRRSFLAVAGAGAVSGISGGAWARTARSPDRWDAQADIIVAGSGAAAWAAAVCSVHRGHSVIMLEKAATAGGTTAKSGAGWWAPNNSHMKRDGIPDPRPDALKYMARCSFPTLYNPDHPRLGLYRNDYELLEAFYDNASVATDELANIGALQSTYFLGAKGDRFLDYYSHFPENRAPRGRCLCPADPDGNPISTGAEMLRQFMEYGARNGITLLLEHAVRQLIMNDNGEVAGVVARHGGRRLAFRGRKAVIFGTGGFTHNPEMALNYLRGPIFGGCAVPANTGDFVHIASEAGARLGNMNNAWWAQIVLEQALDNPSVSNDVFNVPGDSSFLVNRFGRRVVNEKMTYNERTQVHFHWDPVAGEYPNLLLFMIYDRRTVENLGTRYNYPVPPSGASAPYVISGRDLGQLEYNINARLRALAGKLPAGLMLDANFGRELKETVRRFNQYAELGEDREFQRGKHEIDRASQANISNGKPNPTLYPLAEKGPYYSVILAAGTLDTKGGPAINRYSQVLDRNGKPIPGLYGAGNCIASPAGQAYWSGGATIGPALTFGFIAARHAASASTAKRNEGVKT
jgi:3-oxosteroid 1-dehydrogenase